MEDLSMITHEQELQIKNKMLEEKNNQIVKLEMEIYRLRSALEIIVGLESGSRGAYSKFVEAQERARLALGERGKEKTDV
jgi:hypothetical protein